MPVRQLLFSDLVSNCEVFWSRLDSVVDSRPLAVARYDLNQMQQHVAPTWNGRNDGVMQQIRPQNIQQQQGLPLVAHSLPIPVDINTFPPGNFGPCRITKEQDCRESSLSGASLSPIAVSHCSQLGPWRHQHCICYSPLSDPTLFFRFYALLVSFK